MYRARLARRITVGAVTTALSSLLTVIFPATRAAASQVAFSATGAEQSFLVPAGVTTVHVTLVGAPGGNGRDNGGSSGAGGNGAQVTADLAVTPGDTLYIEVGGAGQDGSVAAGGFNGGGNAASGFLNPNIPGSY